MENLARYVVRASFSQERMTPYPVRGRLYIPDESKVVYQSKDGNKENVFDALEWPRSKTAGCKHSPLCLPRRSFAKPGAPMSRTKGNKWFVIMATIVASPGAEERRRTRMERCPVSWNRRNHPGNTEKTGPGLSASWSSLPDF